MSGFHELRDVVYHPGRWHLSSPRDAQGQRIDPWQFFKGRWLELQGIIRFPVKPDGVELDFCWAAVSIPVVHGRFVQLFERLGVQDVQFIPVEVEGHAGPFFILNTLRTLRCIDDARCEEVQYFKPEDEQPEKVGEYKYIAGLRIDPTRVGDARLFRPWGWTGSLIVSEELKQALEAERITGTRFVEV
ncbi:imm11 family protein [Archangium violaceum]|uniref:imm11 family protein n=1 Tax=Archangium violaceum TaxID=83451 RepID=UPI0036DA757E